MVRDVLLFLLTPWDYSWLSIFSPNFLAQIFPCCLLASPLEQHLITSNSTCPRLTTSPFLLMLSCCFNIRPWLHCQFICPETEAWQPLGFSPVSTCKPSPNPLLFCIIVSSTPFLFIRTATHASYHLSPPWLQQPLNRSLGAPSYLCTPQHGKLPMGNSD